LNTSDLGRAQQAYKSVELAPDMVIGGQYSIIKLIGRGGMGEVYLAHHLTLDKICAVKLIPPDEVTEMGWQRFQIEARSISKLDHINLVKVTDFGIHEGCLPYYVMEFVDGLTLAETLSKKGTMPLQVALDLFMQVCDGVDYAHRNGIVHRDLKPGNIMLVNLPNGKLSVKILDFGLAKLIQDDRNKQSLTSVGDVFGSPFYMSPEQSIGGKIDNRSDIYSIGCTLFESLAGRPPFVGATAVDIVSAHQAIDPPSLESIVGRNVFPQAMEVVLAKLLRKNPVERYQTLLELKGDLEKVAQGKDVQPFYMSRSSHVQGPPETIEENLIGSRRGKYGKSPGRSPLNRRGQIVALLIAGVLVSAAAIAWFVRVEPVAKSRAATHIHSDSYDDTLRSMDDAVEGSVRDRKKNLKQDLKQDPVTTDGSNPDFKDGSAFLQKNFPNAIDSSTVVQKVPASLKEITPFASTVVEDGVRLRLFTFPEDVVIGEFQAGKSMEQVLARGKFKFAYGSHVTFIAYPILTKYPGYLKRFRPGDIYTVKFHPGGTDKPDAVLDVMTQLEGVQELVLTGCRELTDNCVPMIGKFHSLQALALGDDNKVPNLSPMALDASAISGLSTLKQLNSLSVQGFDNVQPILHKLKNSPKMKTLILMTPKISGEELADIASLSHLEALTLRGISLSNTDLQILSRLPALERLSLEGMQMGPATVSALQSFKALKELSVGAGGLSAVGQMQLQTALPTVSLRRQN
jgi:serine/threonine protein kinase